MFQLIVFDLDGTLVDSRRDLARSANQLLVECGAHALLEEEIGRMVGNGAPVLIARAFAVAGVPAPADALERFLAIYDARLLEYTQPYPEMSAVLDTLARHVRLAVLTNKPLTPTRAILAGLNLARFFPREAVIGGDGPCARKPDPAGLNQLARQAMVPTADVLLVGDSLVDHQTAKNAGASICMARYGFGFEGFPASELGPGDLVVDQPRELISAVGF